MNLQQVNPVSHLLSAPVIQKPTSEELAREALEAVNMVHLSHRPMKMYFVPKWYSTYPALLALANKDGYDCKGDAMYAMIGEGCKETSAARWITQERLPDSRLSLAPRWGIKLIAHGSKHDLSILMSRHRLFLNYGMAPSIGERVVAVCGGGGVVRVEYGYTTEEVDIEEYKRVANSLPHIGIRPALDYMNEVIDAIARRIHPSADDIRQHNVGVTDGGQLVIIDFGFDCGTGASYDPYCSCPSCSGDPDFESMKRPTPGKRAEAASLWHGLWDAAKAGEVGEMIKIGKKVRVSSTE